MSKVAIWVTTILLLIYFVFTSGLYYWASGSNNTGRFIVPFSWSLSAKEKGFTPIATQSDMDCIEWLLTDSEINIPIICDSNGAFLLSGWSPNFYAYMGNSDGRGVIQYIFNIHDDSPYYIFLTDWNVRNNKYTECSSVGLRRHYPYSIESIPNSKNMVITFNHLINVFPPYQIIPQQYFVREVYHSGGAYIYLKEASQW
jgi:hypothetical protein